jgi:hypothetical protein
LDGSTVVSVIALVVSLGSLAWQLTREQWERPVVIVGGIRGSHNGSSKTEPHWQYRIDVTNVGERAVTLIEAGLISDRRDNGYLITGLSGEEVAEFPIRLEPHDSRSWTIPGGPTSQTSGEYEPWVKVVQRPTWRERRRGTLPERTIIGRLFGSWGPELGGTPSRKPKRPNRRARETAERAKKATREEGQRLL